MRLVEGQTLGMWTVQALVELVEFHEDALVVLVEMEGFLHVFECQPPPSPLQGEGGLLRLCAPLLLEG